LFFHDLMRAIASLPGVRAVAKAGGTEIQADASDIDVHAFCDRIPQKSEREEMLTSFGGAVEKYTLFTGYNEFWGVVDLIYTDGAPICVMYKDGGRTLAYLDSVLAGERLDKEGGFFYPTGLCATIMNLGVFHEDGFLQAARDRLADYPAILSEKLVERHIGKLRDMEDMDSAVAKRDPFFYHCTLDESLDHFFQSLFAMNRVYYPSRKRNISYIEKFSIKPRDCVERLYQAVSLGGKPETLQESSQVWQGLVKEMTELAAGKFLPGCV